jgi:hypothetical protein
MAAMPFHADLHAHSKYSRATRLDVEHRFGTAAWEGRRRGFRGALRLEFLYQSFGKFEPISG